MRKNLFILLGPVLLLTLTACPGPSQKSPVINSFGLTPEVGVAPLKARISWWVSDPESDPLTCKIDWQNDGIVDLSISGCTSGFKDFNYTSVGSFVAKLEVSDGKSPSVSITKSVTTQANIPPAITSISATPSSGFAPFSTVFKWNISDANAAESLTCLLDNDSNGTIDATISNCTSSSSFAVTYPAGDFVATLTVMDAGGLADSMTQPISVQANSAPIISSYSASVSSGTAPLTVLLNWVISDADGNPMSCKIDQEGDGIFEQTISNCTSDSSASLVYENAGTFNATLTVADDKGKTNTKMLPISIRSTSDPFNITINYVGTMTANEKAAFDNAAAKWQSIITAGFGSVNLKVSANQCDDGSPAHNESVDDILIDAQIRAIDGEGKILGMAGPCMMRADNKLPVNGTMIFDSDDVARLETKGTLSEVIFHEMGHVLGYGTVWDYSRALIYGAGTTNPTYNGANAVREWRALAGNSGGNVPLENTGGAGTADSHWRDSVFGNEIMTGYVNATNRLSKITIGSFQDIGYSVDYSAADAFSLGALVVGQQTKPQDQLKIVLRKPQGTIP